MMENVFVRYLKRIYLCYRFSDGTYTLTLIRNCVLIMKGRATVVIENRNGEKFFQTPDSHSSDEYTSYAGL